MLVSFVYLVAWRLFALVLLLARSDRSKELELLVLRHELSILRRQARRPQRTESDRLLGGALSRVLVGFANSGACGADIRSSCGGCDFVLVDEAAEQITGLHQKVLRLGAGSDRPTALVGRPQVEGAVRPPAVVVTGID